MASEPVGGKCKQIGGAGEEDLNDANDGNAHGRGGASEETVTRRRPGFSVPRSGQAWWVALFAPGGAWC